MTSTRTKKVKPLTDIFGRSHSNPNMASASQSAASPAPTTHTGGGPITKAFLESLFSTLRDDLQSVKKELAAELNEVRKGMDSIGERVASLEDKSDSVTELSSLQQELIRLQDQQIDMQLHMEDLENCSRRRNVRIRGDKATEDTNDLFAFTKELFNHILGNPPETEIALDRAHRVGPPRAPNAPPADILVGVHDFKTKEAILTKARTLHPIQFKDQSPVLYQDLAATTLQRRRQFRPAPDHLRQLGIPYSWGHPFRLVFRYNGKLLQLRSLTETCQILGIPPPQDEDDHHTGSLGPEISPSGWQRQGGRRRRQRPNKAEITRGQQEALVATSKEHWRRPHPTTCESTGTQTCCLFVPTRAEQVL